MGKGNQRPNSSDQEKPLSICRDPEKECRCGSSRTESGWKSSPKVPVLLCLVVLLGTLSVGLVVALTVVSARSPLPQPEFSHVCPDTWPGFQGKCYYFSEAEGNWTKSRESCEALGASLATISTRDELGFLLRFKGEANHWIGLEKRDSGWGWISGTALDSRFEVRGGGPCGYLNHGRMSSSLCHTEKNWICSRPDNFVLWEGTLRDS